MYEIDWNAESINFFLTALFVLAFIYYMKFTKQFISSTYSQDAIFYRFILSHPVTLFMCYFALLVLFFGAIEDASVLFSDADITPYRLRVGKYWMGLLFGLLCFFVTNEKSKRYFELGGK